MRMKPKSEWIISWNEFLCCMKRTIGDNETSVELSQMEDLKDIKEIKDIIDFKKLFEYLNQQQIERPKAWVYNFEKSMNNILDFSLEKRNRPHDKEFEWDLVNKYYDTIVFFNRKRETFSVEDMNELFVQFKNILKFYSKYSIRLLDYDANRRHREQYFVIRKGIEEIPKESLFAYISCEKKVYILVGKEYKDEVDALLKKIDCDLIVDELWEGDIEDMGLENDPVDFFYSYIAYYDFCNYTSLTEEIYREGYVYFVTERAILDAFEDEGRVRIEECEYC